MRRHVMLLVAGLALAINSAFVHASWEDERERQGSFLVTRDRIKIPRTWGHLVAVYHHTKPVIGELKYLVFDDDKGNIRHVVYNPDHGIPGAVFLIERE